MTLTALKGPRFYRMFIPRLIIAVIIAVMVIDAYVTFKPLNDVRSQISYWGTILGLWTLVPNILTMWILNIRRSTRISKGVTVTVWRAWVILASFIFLIVLNYITDQRTYSTIYYYIMSQVSTGVAYIFLTAYSLEYAYKTMKISSLEAGAFMMPGIIWFFGHMPLITEGVWTGFGPLSDWILNKMILGGTVGALIAGTVTEVLFAVKSLTMQEDKVIVEV